MAAATAGMSTTSPSTTAPGGSATSAIRSSFASPRATETCATRTALVPMSRPMELRPAMRIPLS